MGLFLRGDFARRWREQSLQWPAVKLVSWNVNGLRAVIRKNFLSFLAEEQPDILCLQETKALPQEVPEVWPEDYRAFWNPAQRKGYSGTTILSRIEPMGVRYGVGEEEHDNEGRVLTLEFPDFFLVNVYVPNSKRDLSRLEYRQEWDRVLLRYLKGLENDKPVIWCGDLNVAHTELDLARPKQNTRTHGFTAEERSGFGAFLAAGFLDTYREFEKGGGHYTWWSQMGGARARNIGWRIDYCLISPQLRPKLQGAFILPSVTGSDHCPVGMKWEG
jgi:exodeoxyribonuclease-3